jgi:hypothetical protein
VHLVVGVPRVAAVDEDVTRLQQLAQLADGRAGRLAGRDHHPDDARLRQLLDELLQAGHVPGRGLVAVVADHRVAAAAQPLGHVATHLAESDQTDLHRDLRVLVPSWSVVPGPTGRHAAGTPSISIQPGRRTGMIR